jgi:ABC-2 type transport system permease protein
MAGSRIAPLARKELLHIVRDPRSLWIIFILPNVLMFLFGYAIKLDLKNVRLGVCDLSRTPDSRALAERLEASSYFVITGRYENPEATEDLFKRQIARAAVVIPEDYARTLEKERRAPVGIFIDGSDANSASLVQNYLETFLATSASSTPSGGGVGTLLSIRPTVFYNRTMDSTNFIVPGLAALVMMLLGALLTSVTIAREKESGTMEQILVSPIKPFEVIAGKVIPYLVLAFSIAMMIIVVGNIWFRVPFVGSPVALMLYCCLYLFTALSLGLLISTLVSTQQVAMLLSLMLTLLPSIMLSGFIFPIASMPRVLQYLSYAIPATHFLTIIRGVMLKGNSPADLWTHIVFLVVIAIALMAIAVKRFSLKLGGGSSR